MKLKDLFVAAAIACSSAVPAAAVSVGAPLVEIDAADITNASILDFFDVFGPSGLKQVDLRGTVTSSIGAPSTVGSEFRFSTNFSTFSVDASLSLGGTELGPTEIYDNSSGTTFYDFDPFQDGPGDLNFGLAVFAPFTEPVFGTFVYTDGFVDWPTRTAPFPELELMVSVYLDGPLPMRSYTDPADPSIMFDFIEGPLSVDRITLSTIDGAPIAPVPLPAGLPLLVAALGGLAVMRRKAV